MNTTANIAFAAAETIQIVGFERDCECSHCGRELKVGVKLDGFGGHFGADCLCKATGKQTVRGITSKASADWLKQLALIAGRGREDAYGFS